MVQGSSCNFLVIPSWREALFIVQSEMLLKWHHSGCAPLLEAAVKGNVNASEDSSRDHGVDQRDGKEQSTLGSETDPGRIAQVGYSRLHTNHREVHATRAPCAGYLGHLFRK